MQLVHVVRSGSKQKGKQSRRIITIVVKKGRPNNASYLLCFSSIFVHIDFQEYLYILVISILDSTEFY